MDELTKLTVNVTPSAVASLDKAAQLTGYSQTDAVNHALQVYAALLELAEQGGGELRWHAFVWQSWWITLNPAETSAASGRDQAEGDS